LAAKANCRNRSASCVAGVHFADRIFRLLWHNGHLTSKLKLTRRPTQRGVSVARRSDIAFSALEPKLESSRIEFIVPRRSSANVHLLIGLGSNPRPDTPQTILRFFLRRTEAATVERPRAWIESHPGRTAMFGGSGSNPDLTIEVGKLTHVETWKIAAEIIGVTTLQSDKVGEGNWLCSYSAYHSSCCAFHRWLSAHRFDDLGTEIASCAD